MRFFRWRHHLAEEDGIKFYVMGPDDMVVLRSTRSVSADQASQLKEILAEKFPGHEVLVLSGDFSLQFIKHGEAVSS